jgi:hypothetical protein
LKNRILIKLISIYIAACSSDNADSPRRYLEEDAQHIDSGLTEDLPASDLNQSADEVPEQEDMREEFDALDSASDMPRPDMNTADLYPEWLEEGCRCADPRQTCRMTLNNGILCQLQEERCIDDDDKPVA